MTLQEAIGQLQHPNDLYDKDLLAVRTVLLHLLKSNIEKSADKKKKK